MELGGTDASAAFSYVHHSADAIRAMKAFEVGLVADWNVEVSLFTDDKCRIPI